MHGKQARVSQQEKARRKLPVVFTEEATITIWPISGNTPLIVANIWAGCRITYRTEILVWNNLDVLNMSSSLEDLS